MCSNDLKCSKRKQPTGTMVNVFNWKPHLPQICLLFRRLFPIALLLTNQGGVKVAQINMCLLFCTSKFVLGGAGVVWHPHWRNRICAPGALPTRFCYFRKGRRKRTCDLELCLSMFCSRQAYWKAFGSTVCMCLFLFWCWFGEQFALFEMFILHSNCELIAIWNSARRCFVFVDVENTTFVDVPCKKSNSLLGMLVPARRAKSRKAWCKIVQCALSPLRWI